MNKAIKLASGYSCGSSGYIGAVRVIQVVSNPVARQILRDQWRKTIHCRISRELPWWGQGRNWGHGHD